MTAGAVDVGLLAPSPGALLVDEMDDDGRVDPVGWSSPAADAWPPLLPPAVQPASAANAAIDTSATAVRARRSVIPTRRIDPSEEH
jgi:hypothetical protein